MSRTTAELLVDGVPRHLVLHTPDYSTAPPVPAMLILHGSTEADDDSDDLNYPAVRFERHYDEAIFAPMRREYGLTMAYLSARRSSAGWFCWENGNGEEVGLCALPSTGGDEAFVRAALGLMDRSVAGGIDASRIYVFGMSGGASMAWKLGCHAPSVAAINASVHVAAVAGTLAPSLRAEPGAEEGQGAQQGACCCAAPSVVAVHGDADGYVDVQSADATARWFGIAHGCNAHDDGVPMAMMAADDDDDDDADDDVELRVYGGCTRSRSRLHYYRVAGGGHTLPGAPLC